MEICRIVTSSKYYNSPEKAKAILEKAISKLNKKNPFFAIVTTGGFIKFPWDKKFEDTSLNKEQIRNGIIENAKLALNECLTPSLKRKFKKYTTLITIGLDFNSDNISDKYSKDFSKKAELIAIVNLKNNSVKWTGKFYSTVAQEKYLIITHDLESHFITVHNKNILILGCHDLSIFNNRSLKNSGIERLKKISLFRNYTNKFKPDLILAHPHYIDSPKIWQNSVGYFKRYYPNSLYALAVNYYGEKTNKYSLNQILKATASEDVFDIVI